MPNKQSVQKCKSVGQIVNRALQETWEKVVLCHT